ncbi:hypothetical protein SAE02_77860 [Skermanella aerolata]|uniref:PAS domain-containing protein n=1 Tax=Skermanella aerolata TaxID=393310 RepID=A0A512E4J6_9PROT|nr:hypothetical protein N826_04680 [Skermanella aerolata KACC 11604]GEO43638.1 hypothetical protein SAE02_77860 [Skermanella aerolata]
MVTTVITSDQLGSIIIFNVSEHNLPDDGYLVPLLRLWCRRRGSAAAPTRSDLPAEDLVPWLGHLAVLEKIDVDFRFRLFGSLLTVSWQEDLTGQLLTDLPEPMAVLLGSVCRQCCATTQPALIQYAAPQRFGGRPRRDLLLPMVAGDGITQLMMASYDVPDPARSGIITTRHLLSCRLDGEH